MNPNLSFLLKESENLIKVKSYFLDEYNYYFHEQQKVKEEIIFALNEKVSFYSFKDWFRLTNTKYATNPLNCKGSMRSPTGGRFNIGDIKEGHFPVFPALYIGDNKKTCLKEIYNGMESFFNSKRADSFFRICGSIHSVLDITKKGSLDKFIKVIKKIEPSKELQKKAENLKLKSKSVKTVTELKRNLYDSNWRKGPSIYDIPSPSQIFGWLVRNAGIEAVLYKSTKTSRSGLCLAIFPENFKNSDSYIKLEDCPKGIKNQKLDSTSYENFY